MRPSIIVIIVVFVFASLSGSLGSFFRFALAAAQPFCTGETVVPLNVYSTRILASVQMTGKIGLLCCLCLLFFYYIFHT